MILLGGKCALVLQEKQVLKQVALPREVYTGSCTQLFDFLAQTLADFIREQQQAGNHGHGKCGLPVVGFCFSFAMEQAALNIGKLLCWSKGFTVEGVLGKDVVQLLSGGYSC
jgi:hexokinase